MDRDRSANDINARRIRVETLLATSLLGFDYMLEKADAASCVSTVGLRGSGLARLETVADPGFRDDVPRRCAFRLQLLA